MRRDDEFWLSVLVVGELRRGIGLLARRYPRAARTWALLSVPDPIRAIDGLLAATAIEHDPHW